MITTTYPTYSTKTAATIAAGRLADATYFLSHGEYERPFYTARKVRGQDAYYVHAKRYFYAGMDARPSGPVGDL